MNLSILLDCVFSFFLFFFPGGPYVVYREILSATLNKEIYDDDDDYYYYYYYYYYYHHHYYYHG